MRIWIVGIGLIFLVTGCAQSTTATSNNVSVSQSTNVPVSASSPPAQSQDVPDWQQYSNDVTNWTNEFMSVDNEFIQFVNDSNKGKYDSMQMISTLGTLQTQLIPIKTAVDTYAPAITVYDTHQLFIEAINDLYNAMQGLSDAQTLKNTDPSQYKKDIQNANDFAQRSSAEMQKYVTQMISNMKQAEGSGS